jgi:hypothetical protein
MATSQACPSDAVMFNKGHSADAFVVNLNQVTGVVPLLLHKTFAPLADDVEKLFMLPSSVIEMALEQSVPCERA